MTAIPQEAGRDEPPSDAYGIGYLEYTLRIAFRDLNRVVGFEEARAINAEIINSEAERKRQ